MKGFSFFVLFVFVIISLQIDPLSAWGNRPVCQTGYSLFSSSCRCRKVSTSRSTCSLGYSRVYKGSTCSCQKQITPMCTNGGVWNRFTCKCTARTTRPTCSAGSTLSVSTAVCTRPTSSYCLPGYVKRGCACILRTFSTSSPKCISGTLSTSKCTCSSSYWATPTCPGGRRAGAGCRCPSTIQCFRTTGCAGLPYRTSSSVTQCCGSSVQNEEKREVVENMTDTPTESDDTSEPEIDNFAYPEEDAYAEFKEYAAELEAETEAEGDMLEAIETDEVTTESKCHSYRLNGRCYTCP